MSKRLIKSLLLLIVMSAMSAFSFGDGIHWDQKEYDFGKIIKDQPVTAVFTMTNNSSDPLLITSVKGSCGCTATDYQKDPIPAGATSSIEATYNAKNLGAFKKTVTVHTNQSKKPIILTLSGEVVLE